MAQRAVRDKAIPIRLACEAFSVSESCYRNQAKNNAENEIIANWLICLTDNNRCWCSTPETAVGHGCLTYSTFEFSY